MIVHWRQTQEFRLRYHVVCGFIFFYRRPTNVPLEAFQLSTSWPFHSYALMPNAPLNDQQKSNHHTHNTLTIYNAIHSIHIYKQLLANPHYHMIHTVNYNKDSSDSSMPKRRGRFKYLYHICMYVLFSSLAFVITCSQVIIRPLLPSKHCCSSPGRQKTRISAARNTLKDANQPFTRPCLQ